MPTRSWANHGTDPGNKLPRQFEAVRRLDAGNQEIAAEVLDGCLSRHDAKRRAPREKNGLAITIQRRSGALVNPARRLKAYPYPDSQGNNWVRSLTILSMPLSTRRT